MEGQEWIFGWFRNPICFGFCFFLSGSYRPGLFIALCQALCSVHIRGERYDFLNPCGGVWLWLNGFSVMWDCCGIINKELPAFPWRDGRTSRGAESWTRPWCKRKRQEKEQGVKKTSMVQCGNIRKPCKWIA